MSNIYFLAGQANSEFEADDPDIISTDRDGIMVECSLADASELARSWGVKSPVLAKDGVHYSESGDVVYIANGKRVNEIETVAISLGWPGFDESGLDARDYLDIINRVF